MCDHAVRRYERLADDDDDDPAERGCEHEDEWPRGIETPHPDEKQKCQQEIADEMPFLSLDGVQDDRHQVDIGRRRWGLVPLIQNIPNNLLGESAVQLDRRAQVTGGIRWWHR